MTELTEMGSLRAYLRAKRIAGCTNGGIMFRGKGVFYALWAAPDTLLGFCVLEYV